MLNVKLMAYTPEPERLVAAAGKLCYSASAVDELFESLDGERIAYFVGMLAENGHGSTLEHVSFTFAIEGLSRAAHIQMIRHRIASYSVQSQRYVPMRDFAHVIPREIEGNPEALAEYTAAMQSAGEHYNRLAAILRDKHCKRLEAEGLDAKEARRKAGKMAIEDARAVLPNSCETKMLMTMNARSLLNFFAHRCCRRAQAEIREIADEMLRLVREVAPLLFAKAGPSCLRGKCPEGAMSCGQIAAMRLKYLDGNGGA